MFKCKNAGECIPRVSLKEMQRLLQSWPKRMGYILNWQQYYILVFRWYWFYRHERFKRDMKACTKFFRKPLNPGNIVSVRFSARRP